MDVNVLRNNLSIVLLQNTDKKSETKQHNFRWKWEFY